MNAPQDSNFTEQNVRYLLARLEGVRARIAQAMKIEDEPWVESPTPEDIASEMPAPPALERMEQALQLDPFEVETLLLCAGFELSAEFRSLIERRTDSPAPSFSFALRVFGDAHWSICSQSRPLRAWGIIEIDSQSTFLSSPIRISDWALSFLLGHQDLPATLADHVRPLRTRALLAPSQQELANELVGIWSSAADDSSRPVLQLAGSNRTELESIAGNVCDQLGTRSFLVRTASLPADARELRAFVRAWRLENLLGKVVLAFELDDDDRRLDRLIDEEAGPALVLGNGVHEGHGDRVLTFEVTKPTIAEQRELWRASVPAGQEAESAIEHVVRRFDLHASTIHAIGLRISGSTRGDSFEEAMRKACHRQLRPQLQPLATRLERRFDEGDLLVPRPVREELGALARQFEARSAVDAMGLHTDRLGQRGLSALFQGPSGTGKTMAAEVIAKRLDLALYRIELNAIIGKYIGETEKNLHRVFDAAEGAGAILLFDEADALFGRRASVQDAHDRYADIEASYLLQRVDSFRGVALFTTDHPDTIDPAFLRRMRFVIDFPFPAPEVRREIWSRTLGRIEVPDLDLEQLAELSLDGERIRGVVFEAAALAADDSVALSMAHLLRAARHEEVRHKRAADRASRSDHQR